MPVTLYGASGDVRAELGNPSEVEYSAEDIRRSRTRATSLINTYLEHAYPSQIPYTNTGDVPEILNTICDDLAVYYAKRAHHHGPNPLSDTIKVEYYENSIKTLELIRDGKIEITELASKRGDTIIANRGSYRPIFDIDGELEQTTDSDLDDHIADERSS